MGLKGGLCVLAFTMGTAPVVARNDDESRTFFNTQWVAPAEPTAAPAPATRTLTIRHAVRVEDDAEPRAIRRLRREVPIAKRAIRKSTLVAVEVGPNPIPTRFNDRTLRPGDAVMTEAGMRVFAGSKSFPYAESNFIPVDKASGLSKKMKLTLASLDTGARR